MNIIKSNAFGKPNDIEINQQRIGELIRKEFSDYTDEEDLRILIAVFADNRWLPGGAYEQKFGINVFDLTTELRQIYFKLFMLKYKSEGSKEVYSYLVSEFLQKLVFELNSNGKRLTYGKVTLEQWLNNRLNASIKVALNPPKVISRLWSKGSFKITGNTTNLASMEPSHYESEHDHPNTSYHPEG